MAGGVLGALLLTAIPGDVIKPFINAYLLGMGVVILVRAFLKFEGKGELGAWVAPLGLTGGFLDAIGGGGWGPVVTRPDRSWQPTPQFYRLGQCGRVFRFPWPRRLFFALIQLVHWRVILGLVIGGAGGAPGRRLTVSCRRAG
jgi:hypothetical protein